MKKILSLVLVLVMAFGSYSFGATDATEGYDAVGNELKGLGIIQGADEGALNSLSKLTRQDAIVILSRLMGKESDAKGTTALSGYSDVPAGFYAPYIAYAKAMNWTNGVSENKFGFGANVTTKQFVTFALRGLGYTADWTTEDVMKKATELGLLQDVNASENAPIIRGEVFKVMKNTLYTVPNGGDKKLVYVLGLKEDESTGTDEPAGTDNPEKLPDPEKPVVTGELEVVDVKATNLKEITIEFNQPVRRTAVNDSVSLPYNVIDDVDLNENGTVATLTLRTSLENNKKYKLNINVFKGISGAKLNAKVVKEFTALDNEVPVAEELKVTGPRQLEVTFSEPLRTAPKVKVRSGKSSWATASVKLLPEMRKIDISTNSFIDGKDYEVMVTGGKDFAGYSNIDKIFTFTYAKDTNAPELRVVKADQKGVWVEFDKPVRGLNEKTFYQTYSSWTAIGVYEDMRNTREKVSPSKAYSKVYIKFAKNANEGHPLPVGVANFYTLGLAGGYKVVDNWGNQLKDTQIQLDIVADTTAPVAEKAEMSSKNEIKITFSEAVQADVDNYEILDSDGKKINSVILKPTYVGYEYENDEEHIILLEIVGKDLTNKDIILNIKGVKDESLAENKMVGTATFSFHVDDKEFKGVKKAILYNKEDNKYVLLVEFEEAVDPETATNYKNYRFVVKGQEFKMPTTVTMFNDSTVQFDLGEKDSKGSKSLFDKYFTGYNSLGDKDKVFVSYNVTDLSGNRTFAFETEGKIEKEPEAVNLSSIYKKAIANNQKTITLVFDKDINLRASEDRINESAIEIKQNLNPNYWDKVKSAYITDTPSFVEIKGNKLVITLKEDREIFTSTEGLEIRIKEDSGNNGTQLVDLLDKKYKGGLYITNVEDAIAPYLVKLPAKKDNENHAKYNEYVNKLYAELGIAYDESKVGEYATKIDKKDDNSGLYTVTLYYSELIKQDNNLVPTLYRIPEGLNWSVVESSNPIASETLVDGYHAGKVTFDIKPILGKVTYKDLVVNQKYIILDKSDNESDKDVEVKFIKPVVDRDGILEVKEINSNAVAESVVALEESINKAKSLLESDVTFKDNEEGFTDSKKYVVIADSRARKQKLNDSKASAEGILSSNRNEGTLEARKALNEAKKALDKELEGLKITETASLLTLKSANFEKVTDDILTEVKVPALYKNYVHVKDAFATTTKFSKYVTVDNFDNYSYVKKGSDIPSDAKDLNTKLVDGKFFIDLGEKTKVVVFQVDEKGKIAKYQKLEAELTDKKAEVASKPTVLKIVPGTNAVELQGYEVDLSAHAVTTDFEVPVFTITDFVQGSKDQVKLKFTPNGTQNANVTFGKADDENSAMTSPEFKTTDDEEVTISQVGNLEITAKISESNKLSNVYKVKIEVKETN